MSKGKDKQPLIGRLFVVDLIVLSVILISMTITALLWAEPHMRDQLWMLLVWVAGCAIACALLLFRFRHHLARQTGGLPPWWLVGAYSVTTLTLLSLPYILIEWPGPTNWIALVGFFAIYLLSRYLGIRVFSRYSRGGASAVG